MSRCLTALSLLLALAPATVACSQAESAQDEIAGSRRNAIVSAAERVAPAVVSVNVRRRERVHPRSLVEEMMLPPGYEREVAGLGSGSKQVRSTLDWEAGLLQGRVGGIADQARGIGLQEGDVVLQINRVQVYFERGGRLGAVSFRIG